VNSLLSSDLVCDSRSAKAARAYLCFRKSAIRSLFFSSVIMESHQSVAGIKIRRRGTERL